MIRSWLRFNLAPLAVAAGPLSLLLGCGGARGAGSDAADAGHHEPSGGDAARLDGPQGTGDVGASAEAGSKDAAPEDAPGDVQFAADPCIAADTCPPGTWINVTPPSINLANTYGFGSVDVDPARPQDVYTLGAGVGVWKSTDYGFTWNGPINTGMNGSLLNDCSYLRLPLNSTATPPTLYMSCIGGDGPGFWRSTNGGVDWTNYNVDPAAPGAYGQQFYAPAVDPYNVNHLLMAVHLSDMIVESMDGGQTWTAINLDPGMLMGGGGVYSISFVDTGTPVMGRSSTWLCIGSEYVAKAVGTWRTTNAGASWTQVETNLHPPGASQIYQQGANGDVYMAGNESTNGDGIFRSTDDGATWTHVGETDTQEKVAFGTSRHLYAMYTGVAALPSTTPVYSPNMQISDTTGLAWTAGTTPAAMAQGPTWAAVTHDGTYNVIVTANYGAGLWRYVEPTN